MYLTNDDMPRQWYNVAADIKQWLTPPLDPANAKPMDPSKLAAIFPENLIEQEMSVERWIDIPEEVLEALVVYRPSPLVRARRLEKFLGTPARIFYKNESVSPAGSHKPNTAIPQAYYNKVAGVRRLTTETGAGQWGSALAYATNHFGLECTVYMVRKSFEQKPFRKSMMNMFGAEVIPSPSDKTKAGRDILTRMPDTPGSLGIAISEAVEDAIAHDDARYSLGSVLNHVLLHQTVTGLEVKKQMALGGVKPDVLIGCCGGGSNFAGLVFPFVPDRLEGKKIRMVAVEPSACPTMTKGVFAYDFGDTGKLTPLLKMYTLGHDFIPPGIHAGGLRYHGMAPLVSILIDQGLVEPVNRHQLACFEAAIMFAKTEGIIPAPESSHAIRVAIDEALRAKEEGQAKDITFLLSGHGHLDLTAYDDYFAGKLHDYEYPEEAIATSMKGLPKV
ncbi:MAG: TrpB-like pyridoxal phosphate-dependent enzyme [Phycisphaerae bacterium]|nr:TrpB-like pyridoxal phosphate-dependent enzyme [Phycisphaerae bacterium]